MIHPRLLLGLLATAWPLALLAQAPAAPPASVQLRGRVVTWQGQPIVGAGTAFAPADSMPTARLLAEPPTRTDAEGRFVLTVPALPAADVLVAPVLLIAQPGMASIAMSVEWNEAVSKDVGLRWQGEPDDARPAPRLDTDLGDIVLPDGARLIGRVRDADGKGLAGVTVIATDLLDDHRILRGRPSRVHCRAVTTASGIFELPCALAEGAVLEFEAAGHLRECRYGIGRGTPLEITMRASGRVAGRVVDADGSIVPGAIVLANYERSGIRTPVRAGDDGRFELTIEYAGRFRVVAIRPQTPTPDRAELPEERAESEVLAGPMATLELVLQPPASESTPRPLRVRAVRADTGQPLADFRAASVWHPFAQQSAAYLDDRARRESRPAVDGEVALRGPAEGESTTGIVVVWARGFAPAYLRDVDGRTGAADDEPPRIVPMVPEATVRGRVVDEQTGAPIAGAVVAVQRVQDPRHGTVRGLFDVDGVTTAADGSFLLAGLGDGDWQVRCEHRARPIGAPIDVQLQPSEQKAGLELKLAAGASVTGRVSGIDIPAGSKVLLHPLAEPRFGGNHVFFGLRYDDATNGVERPIAPDGAFAFHGIALKSFHLVLELPSPPRCGGPSYVPLEPLRVRPGGLVRDIDASLDRPGRIVGRVTFPNAVPGAALPMVIAELLGAEEGEPGADPDSGPRAFVRADGSFTLPVVRGRHRLRLVDAMTGLLLAAPDERHAVTANGETKVELAAPLHELVVQLQGPADSAALTWVDRLEVRHEPVVEGAGQVAFGDGHERYDQGCGLPVPVGTTTLRVWLPAGKVTLFARGSSSQLQRGGGPGDQAPLGREEFELGAADQNPHQVTLRVDGPPAVDGTAPSVTGAEPGRAR